MNQHFLTPVQSGDAFKEKVDERENFGSNHLEGTTNILNGQSSSTHSSAVNFSGQASVSSSLLKTSKQHKLHTSKISDHLTNFTSDGWLWEVMAVMLSVGTFVAIGVVLFIYNGKPLPRLSHGITVRSLISFDRDQP